jgi:hypothetical protein
MPKTWPELQMRIMQLAREGSPPPGLRLTQAECHANTIRWPAAGFAGSNLTGPARQCGLCAACLGCKNTSDISATAIFSIFARGRRILRASLRSPIFNFRAGKADTRFEVRRDWFAYSQRGEQMACQAEPAVRSSRSRPCDANKQRNCRGLHQALCIG